MTERKTCIYIGPEKLRAYVEREVERLLRDKEELIRKGILKPVGKVNQ
jgi:hypothetical protein